LQENYVTPIVHAKKELVHAILVKKAEVAVQKDYILKLLSAK
jgi:hypothetical protein